MTNIQYKYGTSGFRFHHEIVESIAQKIGYVVAYLSSKNEKLYGIMITASHNPYQDNGVKIIDSNGDMIGMEDEHIITAYVNGNLDCQYESTMTYPNIYVGYDTRESSPLITCLIKIGAMNFCDTTIIKEFPEVSTPELHYMVYTHNSAYKMDYIEHLDSILKLLKSSSIICDCANGVGSNVIHKVNRIKERINVINNATHKFKLLNKNSGSDFVVNNRQIPDENPQSNTLYASLDGDADRVVFYYQSNEEFHLLNGDKISALIAYYISSVLPCTDNIAVIHTGYSNQSFIDYIKTLGIQTKCTATGVKNLHKEALKYDVSIYFESNGHGTVLFNKKYKYLEQLEKFFHPTIGDGVMDMLAVLFILQETNLSVDEWKNFYTDRPYLLSKMSVADKDIFKTSSDELTLTQPRALQHYIDSLSYDGGVCAFVRPSGTENYLRLYVEANSHEQVNYVTSQLSNAISSEDYTTTDLFEKNGTYFKVSNISSEDFHTNYLYLLQQLTSIDPEQMTFEKFDAFVKELDANHQIKLVRELNTNKIVGSITILIERKLIHNFGKVAHIEDVVVDTSMRGYGMGRKLLEIAEKECSGCYKIILDCSDENTPFYEKCGYTRKGNEMAKYVM